VAAVTDKKKTGPSRSDRDGLKTRVRTAKFRKVSSTRWLQRQLNDPYVVKARKEGYRSRAAYKLLEIDEKHKLLKPGQKIVDLGCAPGGWAQIAARVTGSAESRAGAKVVGVDLLDVDPIAGVIFEKLDFNDDDAPARLHALLGGKADGVLSDMAANTTGHKKTDQIRIAALVELAADFAVGILAPGGFFLAKVFQGGTESELMAILKKSFASVKHIKPPASRQESSEYYLLATGFRGNPNTSLAPLPIPASKD
jgi:23S rRNA (uridine2552-2'-O)-methyltransferase